MIILEFIQHFLMALTGSFIYVLFDMDEKQDEFDKDKNGWDLKEIKAYGKKNLIPLIIIGVLAIVAAWQGEIIYEVIAEWRGWENKFNHLWYFATGPLFVLLQYFWKKYKRRTNGD